MARHVDTACLVRLCGQLAPLHLRQAWPGICSPLRALASASHLACHAHHGAGAGEKREAEGCPGSGSSPQSLLELRRSCACASPSALLIGPRPTGSSLDLSGYGWPEAVPAWCHWPGSVPLAHLWRDALPPGGAAICVVHVEGVCGTVGESH